MSDEKQPIARAEAVRIVAAYMNPSRMLDERKDSEIELVESVISMIEEGRPVPAELHVLEDVVTEEIKRVRELREAMSAKTQDYVSKWSGGGHVDLNRYREHGSGVHLFRAYINRRAADEQKNGTRETAIKSKLAGWKVEDGYTEDMAESVMLEILKELDPIIRDLLKFCEDPNSADDTLPKLRGVLRIGKGLSPYDVDLDRKEKHGVYLWYRTYVAMENGEIPFKSMSATAKDIAKELEVSVRTAFNYWERAKRERPLFTEWGKSWLLRTRRAGTADGSEAEPPLIARTDREPPDR